MRALYPTGVNSGFGVVPTNPVVTTIVSDNTTTTTDTGSVTTDAGSTTITTTGGTTVVVDTGNVVTIGGTVVTGAVVTGTPGTGTSTVTTPGGTTITIIDTGGGTVIVDTTITGHEETGTTVVNPGDNLPVTILRFKSPCSVEFPDMNFPTMSCVVQTNNSNPPDANILVSYDGLVHTQSVEGIGHTIDIHSTPYSETLGNTGELVFSLGVDQVVVKFTYEKSTMETIITLIGCKYISKSFEVSTGKTTVVMNTVIGHVIRAIGILVSTSSSDNIVITTGETTPTVIGLVNDVKLTATELTEALASIGISFEPTSVLLTNKSSITDTLITVGEPTDPIINPNDPPTPVPTVAVNEVKAPWTMYFPVKVGEFIFALNSFDSGTETTGAMQLVKFNATTLAFISQVRISKRRIHWLSSYGGHIYSVGVSDLATNPTSNIQSFCKFDTDLNLLESVDLPYTGTPPFKWAHTAEGLWTNNRNTWVGKITYTLSSHYASEISTPSIYSSVITDGSVLWYWGSSNLARYNIADAKTVAMNFTLLDGVVVGDYIYGITPTNNSIPKLNRWHKYSGAIDVSFGYEMKNEPFSNGYHQVHTDGRYVVFGAADIQVYDTVSNSIVYTRPRNTYHMSKAAHFMAPGKLVIVVNDISYDQRSVIAAYSLVVTL